MLPEKLVNIPLCERIFCNRSLNMSSIKAVGFDMDYTLAIYKHESFEKLAYDETLKKLVQNGYPKEILDWKFDNKYMVRGLVIDKKLGNILKIDRHRYVKLAYHGFKELTRDERRKLYDVENIHIYEEPNFALVDTIFSLAEAFLFTQLVNFKETTNTLDNKNFEQIHQDVRKCIDLCHRDGSIKHKIAYAPEKYIKYDCHLAQVLQDLRSSGRKVFIVTNSLWEYTNVVMNFLLNSDKSNRNNWMDFFDIIITGSQKPNFFTLKSPLYEVNLESGLLKNIEILPVMKESSDDNTSCLYPKVFQGGHVKLLHDMLNIQKGSEILYIGDHIYGDILRSKKEIGWRTMLVVEELEWEINNYNASKQQYDTCCSLISKKEALMEKLDQIQLAIIANKKNREISCSQLKNISITELEDQAKKIASEILILNDLEDTSLSTYHKTFHPIWGELMKTGMQNSRFSAQVFNYSCLYTSKVTNLRHYGPLKNFSAVSHAMPHEMNS